MSIRSDSYSSTSEIKPFVRHLLSSNSTAYTTFNSTTRPTLAEVEKFIDRVSGVLNGAMWRAGFSPTNIQANSTAKLICDDFVTMQSVAQIELTQRGEGFGSEENNRFGAFRGLYRDVKKFVEDNALGFKFMGVTDSKPASQGLVFTGLDVQADRTDPDDSSLEQPAFKRRQFDNRGAYSFTNSST